MLVASRWLTHHLISPPADLTMKAAGSPFALNQPGCTPLAAPPSKRLLLPGPAWKFFPLEFVYPKTTVKVEPEPAIRQVDAGVMAQSPVESAAQGSIRIVAAVHPATVQSASLQYVFPACCTWKR